MLLNVSLIISLSCLGLAGSAWGQFTQPETAEKTEIPAQTNTETQALAKPDEPATQEPPGKEEAAPVGDPSKPSTPSLTKEELDQLIRDLVNPRFAVRQTASQKLVKAGLSGMEAAAAAAQTDDLELATRCLAVLSEGLASSSPDVQNAARKALTELAKSERQSVAQRARLALETRSANLPAVAGRGTSRQIRVQVVNGVREITVKEDTKETVIQDDNGKDITITVTHANGQPPKQVFEGKDEEDLKKKHPEAHAIYKQYTGGPGRGFRVQIGGANPGAFPGGIPGPGNIFVPAPQARPRRFLNPLKAAELFEEVERQRLKLQELQERLEKSSTGNPPRKDDLRKIAEELKGAVQKLEEITGEAQIP